MINFLVHSYLDIEKEFPEDQLDQIWQIVNIIGHDLDAFVELKLGKATSYNENLQS